MELHYQVANGQTTYAIDNENNRPYVQPDFNEARFQMYRFLQTPPSNPTPIINNDTLIGFNPVVYENQVSTWNADIHLISTYKLLF